MTLFPCSEGVTVSGDLCIKEKLESFCISRLIPDFALGPFGDEHVGGRGRRVSGDAVAGVELLVLGVLVGADGVADHLGVGVDAGVAWVSNQQKTFQLQFWLENVSSFGLRFSTLRKISVCFSC